MCRTCKEVLLTQEWDDLQHGSDLLQGAVGLAALVGVAAEAVDPAQQPAALRLGFPVELLQQLGGDRKVFLETFAAQDEFDGTREAGEGGFTPTLGTSPASSRCRPCAASC